MDELNIRGDRIFDNNGENLGENFDDYVLGLEERQQIINRYFQA